MESPRDDERERLVGPDTSIIEKSESKHRFVTIRTNILPASDTDRGRNGKFDWKPKVLRSVSLLVLLLTTLAMVGILELAVLKLPHGGGGLDETLRNMHIGRDALAADVSLMKRSEGISEVSNAKRELRIAGILGRQDNTSSVAIYTASTAYAPEHFTEHILPTFPPAPVYSAESSSFAPEHFSYTSSEQPPMTMTAEASSYLPSEGSYTRTASHSAQPGTISMEATPPSAFVPKLLSITSSTQPTSIMPIYLNTSSHAVANSNVTAPPAHFTPPPPQATPPPNYVPETFDHGRPDVLVYEWTPTSVFVAAYLPLLIAVVFRMWWSQINDKISLIDPFRQLSRPGGALATNAFFFWYHERSSLFRPFLAMWKGRFAIWCGSSAYLLMCFLPALASEAFWVDTNWGCSMPNDNYPNNPCPARMTVSVLVVRVLQGILGLTAIGAILVATSLYFRRTGLREDPSSLASVASLMQDPDSYDELNTRQIGNHNSDKKAFAGQRFWLDAWDDEVGRQHFGIRGMGLQSSPRNSMSPQHARSPSYSSLVDGGIMKRPIGKKTAWRPLDVILGLISLGTLAVILAYYLDYHHDSFNDFFNSNTFGPRFILTGTATIIANMWKDLEHDTMIMAPFIRLYSQPSAFSSTMAFASTVTPFVSTWRALRHGYFLAFLVTLVALAGEALNVVISGIPYSPGLVWMQFIVSAYMSMAILGLMVLTSGIVILCRRREPQLPVRPTTLAGKMGYLAGSRVLGDFLNHEWEGVRERRLRIGSTGKKYRLEPVIMDDGSTKWLITDSLVRFV